MKLYLGVYLLFIVPLVVVETESVNTESVSCDFSDNEFVCGYTVGESWQPTVISYFDSSGNAQLLKCDAY